MKTNLKLFKIAGLIILLICLGILGVICLWNYENKDITEDIKKYDAYLGKEGKFKVKEEKADKQEEALMEIPENTEDEISYT